jgi:uncharacterized protein YkwD
MFPRLIDIQRLRNNVLHSCIARRGLVSAAVLATTFSAMVTASPQASAASSRGDIAVTVLRLINSERAAHRVPLLRMNAKLVAAARGHNLAMSSANSMTHQVAGEANFARRISAVKYRWRAAAENVGSTTDTSVNGALGLQSFMYNETAPANGHRLNILNRKFREVGIDVLVDDSGRLWLTEDFGRSR